MGGPAGRIGVEPLLELVPDSKLRSVRRASVKIVPSATDSDVTRRRTVLASWTRRLDSAISLASWRSGLMVNSSTSRTG